MPPKWPPKYCSALNHAGRFSAEVAKPRISLHKPFMSPPFAVVEGKQRAAAQANNERNVSGGMVDPSIDEIDHTANLGRD